jgi:hypothetical protein
MKARGYFLDPNGNLGVPPRMVIQCIQRTIVAPCILLSQNILLSQSVLLLAT